MRLALRLPLHRKLALSVSCVRRIHYTVDPYFTHRTPLSSLPRRSVKISQKRPQLGRVCASPYNSPSRTVRPRSPSFPLHLRSSFGRSRVRHRYLLILSSCSVDLPSQSPHGIVKKRRTSSTRETSRSMRSMRSHGL